MSLEDIQKTPQYMDFLSKLPFLYDGYCETKGIEAVYGYPWVLYLLAGHTVDEVKALAKETIAYELGNKLSKQKWVTPENFQTKAGAVSYSYKTGLRVYPEMQDLIAAFEANGIDVFVVSASYKPVVEVFSGIGNFGYNVPAERVIAMELASSPDGKILPESCSSCRNQYRSKADSRSGKHEKAERSSLINCSGLWSREGIIPPYENRSKNAKTRPYCKPSADNAG